jgi:cell migration-inducing and hyaluronan-binding protein
MAVDDEACEIKPSWNAALCTGDVGRMSFVNGRGLAFGALGFGGGFGGADEDSPFVLSRDGYEVSVEVGTNIRANTEFKVTTERTEMELHAIELDEGSWVIVEIPEFTNADSGVQVDSLDALRDIDTSSYYKADDTLWVKLVSPGDSGIGGHSGGVMMQVSR